VVTEEEPGLMHNRTHASQLTGIVRLVTRDQDGVPKFMVSLRDAEVARLLGLHRDPRVYFFRPKKPPHAWKAPRRVRGAAE
jgi:hypothetical protein